MDATQRMVLDLVVEDTYGLWEVLWRLRTTQPDLPQDAAMALARGAVVDLHSQGLVALELRRAGGSELVPAAEVRELLDATSRWEEPQKGAEAVFVLATANGQEAYYRA